MYVPLHKQYHEAMHSVLNSRQILQNMASDFRAMKKIAEDANDGWKQYLSNGFTLIQELETRFRTQYLVADRFSKSALKVLIVLKIENRSIATTAFEEMKKD